MAGDDGVDRDRGDLNFSTEGDKGDDLPASADVPGTLPEADDDKGQQGQRTRINCSRPGNRGNADAQGNTKIIMFFIKCLISI